MSRIRTVKPEFWTSEQVTSVSRDARLLFIGIFNFCDDSGIHSGSAQRLKAEIFPADNDITSEEITAWVGELELQGLLETYDVEGKAYIRVTGWKRHQKIEKPTYRHPWPCGTIPSGDYGKLQFEKLFDEYSTSPRRVLGPGMERIGMESIGEEGNGDNLQRRRLTYQPEEKDASF